MLATTATANLVEVFSAIQGEGLNVGTRQIFIRFGKCDLRCHFCDSDHTWETNPQCRIEITPGQRDFQFYDNPVEESQLLAWIQKQHQGQGHDSISLTGGEPLLHAKFLKSFLPQLRQLTFLPIYIETGGHRPQQLSLVLPYLNSVGMDLKLPSVSGEQRWQAHKDCLQRCWDAQKEVFAKLIVSNQTSWQDLEQARHLVAEISPYIPIILQPVTPVSGEGMTPPSSEQVLSWQSWMKQSLSMVRVIPQTHKLMGQL